MVNIFTLGRFLIKRDGQILTKSSVRSKKVWVLFQYLLTHREMAILPEAMLETLWPGKHYRDPNLAVRSLIHRLRALFRNELDAPELASKIVFAQNCYRWTENGDCWLDAEEFEEFIVGAGALSNNDPRAAIDLLNQANRLYLGEYLPECSSENWVLPARSYYHQLYIKGMTKLVELQRGAGHFSEIIDLCTKVLEIDYYEERLHLHYLEALLREGKNKQARTHYEKMTAAFYREMGTKPSLAMRQLYGRICFDQESSINFNLSLIQECLSESEDMDGALVCDFALFKYFYQLEQRRQQRSGQPAYLGLFTLTFPDYQKSSREKLQQGMDYLQGIMKENLRKGDIICRSHESQFLVILADLDANQSLKVLARLDKMFTENFPNPDIRLHRKLQLIAPAKEHCLQ